MATGGLRDLKIKDRVFKYVFAVGKKVALGATSATQTAPGYYRVYVPTRYGGTLKVTSSSGAATIYSRSTSMTGRDGTYSEEESSTLHVHFLGQNKDDLRT